jgi:hypothetical protein
MHRIEAKLAEWHRIHKEHQQARMRLQAATAAASQRARIQLQQEVDRLKNESDQALEQVFAALNAVLPPQAREKLGE